MTACGMIQEVAWQKEDRMKMIYSNLQVGIVLAGDSGDLTTEVKPRV